ncbi:hypothetical protein BASA62_010259 [Batrachochytrium salamandrivorans]|nr:hypothetical protein BASA62_010259 [Batrachochytrium salamandrivorans]
MGNPSQNRIQDKLNKLRLSHEDLEDYISKVKETIISLRQRQSTLESEMKQLRDMLSKKYIKEESKLELRAVYTSLFGTWNQVRTTEKSQKADLQEVEKERDSTGIELKTLEQNQKRRMEHNSRHQNQLELSPNSDYSKDIMKQQLGEACLKAKDLVMAKKSILKSTGVENVYTWLRGGVLNSEADLDQRWLDGTVEHGSMGTRHDNRALAATG